MLRTAGFPLIICPSVAVAHMLVTGSAPPAITMVAVALVAAVGGMLADRSRLGAVRLTAQLACAQVLGHLTVYLALGEPSNGCLPAMGRGAELGLRLAILRQQASCDPGHYAAGILATTAAAVLLVAAAVVLWQILVAAGGSALLRMAERAWTTVAALLAAVALAVQEFTALVITGMSLRRPTRESRTALQSVIVPALRLRAPPALGA